MDRKKQGLFLFFSLFFLAIVIINFFFGPIWVLSIAIGVLSLLLGILSTVQLFGLMQRKWLPILLIVIYLIFLVLFGLGVGLTYLH